MYTFYSLLLALGALATSPYWLFKAIRQKKYLENFRQRLGWDVPAWDPDSRPLWIHAVSVGEVLAAKPLLARLRTEHPRLPVVVSTVTLTGQALARRELAQAALHFFFPFDWDFCIEPFLNRLRPRAVLLMETELWPNFIRKCAERSVPILIANGRISDRSVSRYRLVRPILAQSLSQVSMIAVQSAEYERRFLSLGARTDQLRVTGNVKFDLPSAASSAGDDSLRKVRACLGLEAETTTIVIGSSMKGEEVLFLQAFQKVYRRLPQARLILAPRHPERFEEVARLIADTGLSFLRRSQTGSNNPPAVIFLLDTIGELRSTYSLAALAVIGGSFLPFGGHNLLEPAALGKAILFGPHMHNFREAADLFLQQQAARQCTSESLADVMVELLADDQARRLMGERARSTFRQNQGATADTLSAIAPYIL